MAFSVIRGLTNISKFFPTSRSLLCNSFRVAENTCHARTITRSFFVLCRKRDETLNSKRLSVPWSNTCNCGMHSKGDKELSAFLEEEIANESKSKVPQVPAEVEGFVCKYEGSDVTLTKQFNNESITIRTNVNHSVDAEDTIANPNENDNDVQMGEMKSKPDFTVEISKGKKVLSFECSFSSLNAEDPSEDAYNDSFQIDEISLYENEMTDVTYSVSGEIIDGYLYDLLMNHLDERGISNDFADKMVKLLTTYEHGLYVGLLQGMKRFIDKN